MSFWFYMWCTAHNKRRARKDVSKTPYLSKLKYQNLLYVNLYKFVSSSPQVDTDSPLISLPVVTVHYPGKKNATYQTNIKITGTTGLHTVCTHIVDSG